MSICPSCGSNNVAVKTLPEYEYDEYGLGIVLLDAVQEVNCHDCSTLNFGIPAESQLLALLKYITKLKEYKVLASMDKAQWWWKEVNGQVHCSLKKISR